jgi:ribosomal protein L14
MILKQTILSVTDKSGLDCIKVFHLYGGFYRHSTKIGFFIKGSCKKVTPKNYKNKLITRKKFFKKGHITKAIITRQSFHTHRNDGSVLKLKDNTSLTIKKNKLLVSKYIYGPGFIDLRRKKFLLLFKKRL